MNSFIRVLTFIYSVFIALLSVILLYALVDDGIFSDLLSPLSFIDLLFTSSLYGKRIQRISLRIILQTVYIHYSLTEEGVVKRKNLCDG